MPTVDPKPNHRPFRRVLYREDSKDSTVIKDVSPRNNGHLITKPKKKPKLHSKEENPKLKMTSASRTLLMREGTLYKSPLERIKYVKRVRNNRMARYLFVMQQYNTSSMATHPRRGNNSLLIFKDKMSSLSKRNGTRRKFYHQQQRQPSLKQDNNYDNNGYNKQYFETTSNNDYEYEQGPHQYKDQQAVYYETRSNNNSASVHHS
ncbi:unnamed protein product [Rotaria magnacalcarata]|uniref:Uncharacterized protein n=5 Tax=Rotaria TaxID=231623 RepID=A0A819AXB1_9BILA|nr:unnamed protein product [Rotaria magnacalcarata]CAF3762303.1 unnamed protein product [Rotaria magnacalcarata]CAF3784388.1 unnamed protein product [Rotaria magnacalcarata]